MGDIFGNMQKNFKKNNVLLYSYTKRYYILHPWSFITETIRNIKAAYHRIIYGWAYRDCWELGYYLLNILPDMLKVLSTGCGYPGDEKFPTPESWKNHLLSIANLLENAREEVRDQKNEYYAGYMEHIEKNWGHEWTTDETGNKVYRPVDNDIVKKYFKREQELAEEQDVMAEEALKMLAETPIKRIWD